MIYGVYAIKDEKVGFKPLFANLDDKEVVVSFKRLVKSGAYGDATPDLSLYQLGTYDSDTAHICCSLIDEKCVDPMLIITAKEILEEKDLENGKQDQSI